MKHKFRIGVYYENAKNLQLISEGESKNLELMSIPENVQCISIGNESVEFIEALLCELKKTVEEGHKISGIMFFEVNEEDNK